MEAVMGHHYLSIFFFVAALVGGAAVVAQLGVVAWWSARRKPARSSALGVTILKPLCGVDDDLVENLESLRRQTHRNYEVLLGVKNDKDAAYPIARKFALESPEIFRLILQRGEAGMNPKVNQLVTLARHARHELLFISDSN
ncbi:MAG: glycosyltransferase, partial [Myxococcaceae bacterium]